MTAPATARPGRFPYGIDAPYVPSIFLGVGLAAIVLVVIGVATGWLLVIAFFFWLQGAVYLYATLRGKLRVWERILDRLQLGGGERVLDVGCGRGAVLIACAKRLPAGRAVGVDLWRTQDQSGNDPSMTTANAAAEHVADRIELHTADMTELPFADATYDLVLSSLAMHNLPVLAARYTALEEAVRVLKPGGRLVVADIRTTRQYAEHLRSLGVGEVTRRSAGPAMWWGGPWQSTTVVTLTKIEHTGS